MAERNLCRETVAMLESMSADELRETLIMMAHTSTTRDSKLAVLCQAMAHIMDELKRQRELIQRHDQLRPPRKW